MLRLAEWGDPSPAKTPRLAAEGPASPVGCGLQQDAEGAGLTQEEGPDQVHGLRGSAGQELLKSQPVMRSPDAQ